MQKLGRAVSATFQGESIHNAPDHAHSKMTMAHNATHNLPLHVIVLFTILIPCLVAVINVGMVGFDLQLITFKFNTMERLMQESGNAWIGGVAMAGICALYALCSACLVLFVDPKSAGSGLPEAKSYMNGNPVDGFWSLKGLFVRAAGVILTVAAGFPVGREGPMVGIGGCVGVAVVTLLATPYMSKWVKMDSEDGTLNSALITDESRFAYALRLGCVLGSSAGIAVAFNAPIGGILYMFEEVTVTNWAPETTFKAFVGSVAAVLLSQVLMKLLGSAAHTLLIFDPDASPGDQKNGFIDWVFVAVAAAFIGALSAIYAKNMAAVWSWRKRMATKLSQRGKVFAISAKLLEAMAYAAFCAMVFCLIPSLIPCDENTHASGSSSGASLADAVEAGSSGSRRLAGGLIFRPYTCDDGEHNKVATLFLTGAEGAVKHLFDQTKQSYMGPVPLALSLAVYFVLACGMPGLQVPMGCFVPSMLMGAMSGRLFGELFGLLGAQAGFELAAPGVYSMAGAAAFLGGFTHMTLAITALLVEATRDLSLVPILMLSIAVSHVVSTSISHHGYDEVLIHKKGVAYLEPELPHDMEDGKLAIDLMDEYPESAILSEKPALDVALAALKHEDVEFFPVVDPDGVCTGTVLRLRLEAAVQAHENAPVVEADAQRAVIAQLARRPSNNDVGGITIPVHRIMDHCPHTLLEDMPVSRFYYQFSLGSLDHAAVISKNGEFRGVMTRRNLISAAGHVHAGHSKVRRSVLKPDTQGEQPAIESDAPVVLLGNTKTKAEVVEKPVAVTADTV